MGEFIPISPYASFEDSSPLSAAEIRQRNPKFREAGQIRYGCWGMDLMTLEERPPIQADFFRLFDEANRERPSIKIADCGCGHGKTMALSYWELSLKMPGTSIKRVFIDIQSEALDITREVDLKLFASTPRISSVYLQADMVKKDTEKLIRDGLGETADGVICSSLLHFITDENEMHNAVSTLRGITEPKTGLIFVVVNSVYNPSCIGSNVDPRALEMIEKLTYNGKADKPIVFRVPQMDTNLSFFTHNSLNRLLNEHGFNIISSADIIYPNCRNNLTDNRTGHIGVIAKVA